MFIIRYMPDCIKCTIDLLEADPAKLTSRIYNITGMSFTPAQQAESIRKVMPEFKISYKPDFRQAIADSWPKSIDDSLARKDWGWKHQYVFIYLFIYLFTYLFFHLLIYSF
jgi:threonine 3-dehydrogenase